MAGGLFDVQKVEERCGWSMAKGLFGVWAVGELNAGSWLRIYWSKR